MLGLGNSLARGGVLSGFENNYSLEFDGTDDYVDCGNALHFSTTPFTVSAWVQISDDNSVLSVYGMNDDDFTIFINTEWNYIKVTTSGGESCQVNNAASSPANAIKTMVENGGWHHLVFVRGSGAANNKIYLDSVSHGHDTMATNTINDTDIADSAHLIGIGDGSDNEPFNGKIDEVAIWDVALSAANVVAIYNSGTPFALDEDNGNYDKSGDLQGWWRMGDGALDDFGTASGLIANQVNPTLGSEMAGSLDWNNNGSNPYETFTSSGNVVSEAINTGWGIVYTDDFSLTSGNSYKVRYNLTLNSGVVPDFARVSRNDSLDAGTDFSGVPVNGINTHYFSCSDSQSDFKFGFRLNGSTSWSLSDLSIKPVNGNPGIMTNMDAVDIVKDTP